ncbi:unnamed protein product, partial [Brenthis ino]
MRSPSTPARWRRVGSARAPYPIGGGRGAPANRHGAGRRRHLRLRTRPHRSRCDMPSFSAVPVRTFVSARDLIFLRNFWG